MRAIQGSGRSVPGDLAVVGFNNIDLAELVDPPLTTVAVPMYEIGRQAMRMLEKLISGANTHFEEIIFETSLVVRKSCGCASSPD